MPAKAINSVLSTAAARDNECFLPSWPDNFQMRLPWNTMDVSASRLFERKKSEKCAICNKINLKNYRTRPQVYRQWFT